MVKRQILRISRGVIPYIRLRGPLEADPTARMLHVLLAILAVWIVAAFASTIRLAPMSFPRWFGALVLEASYVLALVMLRLGNFRRASLAYLSGVLIWATLLCLFAGGIRSPGALLYVSLPASAAWLLGYQASLWTAGACLLGGLVFTVLAMTDVRLPYQVNATPLGIWTVVVQAVLINALPVGQIIGKLRETLRELRLHQQDLEALIEQRTRELVQARNEAESTSRVKSAFLANMSHELRTPLNAILGFSAMMATDASLSDRHRKDLGIVGRSGEHLLRMIDKVLDMAKIESGRMELEIAAFDLHGLLQDIAKMAQVRAAAKNLALTLEISPPTPRSIRCDPGRLRQALTNLLGNAVNYTDTGGVVMRAHALPGKTTNEFTLILEVEDTGIGIAPEDQARIFEPFVQAGSRKAGDGTGLGLSICWHVVQLLGGTIQLASVPGRGSRFWIKVPVQAAESSEVMIETAVMQQVIGLEAGQPEYRVLIVEDQEENWLLLERLLETAGFQVRLAKDGREAVESFELWQPDFIWMDIRLPVMNGAEATKHIRELKTGTEVKIVAVTSSTFASEREELLDTGFDDFLRKPCRPEEIFSCMARHLGVRYRYGVGQQLPVVELPARLRPEDLATVPANLRNELKNAVIKLDTVQVKLVAGQISEHDTALGNALTGLASQCTLTPILAALESCEADDLKASS